MEDAKKIVKLAIDNFQNRKVDVMIPGHKATQVADFGVKAIEYHLGGTFRGSYYTLTVFYHLRSSCPELSGGNDVSVTINIAPNVGMAMKLAEIKPDAIYLSSCLANAKPDCPYSSTEDMANIIENKTGIKVVIGTHDYH